MGPIDLRVAPPPTPLPLEGLRVYLSGPGDRYGAVEPTDRERAVKDFHGTLREALLNLGAVVVRDRNIPGRARGYDAEKVRFLLRTCDLIVAFCYGRHQQASGWQTSEYVLDEIRLALDSGVGRIVVLRDDALVDQEFDRLALTLKPLPRAVIIPRPLDTGGDLRRLVLDACGDIGPVERQIFTVIPFDESFRDVFTVIADVLHERTRLPVRRIKDMLVGSATRDVPVVDALLDAIRRAPLVVLELSGRNSNCFFEAGVAVACSVPTIRLIREEEEIPFDVRNWGFVKYKNLEELRAKLETEANRFARDEVTVERLA